MSSRPARHSSAESSPLSNISKSPSLEPSPPPALSTTSAAPTAAPTTAASHADEEPDVDMHDSDRSSSLTDISDDGEVEGEGEPNHADPGSPAESEDESEKEEVGESKAHTPEEEEEEEHDENGREGDDDTASLASTADLETRDVSPSTRAAHYDSDHSESGDSESDSDEKLADKAADNALEADDADDDSPEKQGSPEDSGDEMEEGNEEEHDEAGEHLENGLEEEAIHAEDENGVVDVVIDGDMDLEGDAADFLTVRRLEAMGELTRLEVQFSMIKDRLYIERMTDLDKEEAALRAGTHKELTDQLEELDRRKLERLKTAEERYNATVAAIKRKRVDDERLVWGWWRYERDELHRDMVDNATAYKRGIERDKANLERYSSPRPVTPPIPASFMEEPPRKKIKIEKILEAVNGKSAESALTFPAVDGAELGDIDSDLVAMGLRGRVGPPSEAPVLPMMNMNSHVQPRDMLPAMPPQQQENLGGLPPLLHSQQLQHQAPLHIHHHVHPPFPHTHQLHSNHMPPHQPPPPQQQQQQQQQLPPMMSRHGSSFNSWSNDNLPSFQPNQHISQMPPPQQYMPQHQHHTHVQPPPPPHQLSHPGSHGGPSPPQGMPPHGGPPHNGPPLPPPQHRQTYPPLPSHGGSNHAVSLQPLERPPSSHSHMHVPSSAQLFQQHGGRDPREGMFGGPMPNQSQGPPQGGMPMHMQQQQQQHGGSGPTHPPPPQPQQPPPPPHHRSLDPSPTSIRRVADHSMPSEHRSSRSSKHRTSDESDRRESHRQELQPRPLPLFAVGPSEQQQQQRMWDHSAPPSSGPGPSPHRSNPLPPAQMFSGPGSDFSRPHPPHNASTLPTPSLFNPPSSQQGEPPSRSSTVHYGPPPPPPPPPSQQQQNTLPPIQKYGLGLASKLNFPPPGSGEGGSGRSASG